MNEPNRPLPLHGAAALACWLVHGGHHVASGTAHDLLWGCNVAVPLLAVGTFFGHRLASAVALSWLAFGTPIWLLDLATGKNMIPTSVLVHLVAPAIGVDAARRLGWPTGAWRWACVAAIFLLVATRLVGSERTNVNLAFRVHDGWEDRFRSHPLFLLLLVLTSALVFFLVERVALRLLRSRSVPREPR